MPTLAIKAKYHGLTALLLVPALCSQEAFNPTIPRTWDHEKLTTMELPNAATGDVAKHVSAAYYESIPPTKIYKTYPVYVPEREPEGYFEMLQQAEPELVFDRAQLKTREDWLRAGELVFRSPSTYTKIRPGLRKRMGANFRRAGIPLTPEGINTFMVYAVRKKGEVEIGILSCASCHTRIMPDGSLVLGAQGNNKLGVVLALNLASLPQEAFAAAATELWGMPSVAGTKPPLPADPQKRPVIAALRALPRGVAARQGTSPFSPVQVPDLIGVKNRKYLDRTGLIRHRGIGDLMRYAALNQGLDKLSMLAGFTPAVTAHGLEDLPPPATRFRYSDEQLYALALFVYSLKPPENPNEENELSRRGKAVFKSEKCSRCHKPPLYTSNQLTPVKGFKVPDALKQSDDIRRKGVGTDPTLALTTRRGTGFYKVPSLLGVWYRGPFSHDGSVATLEDWFDPARRQDDYVPTGWNPGGKARAVPGHRFGHKLSADDKQALLAFLRTL